MINLRKEVTWQVWPMVLLPKIKGGICVLNLILQNEALLLKQLHHLKLYCLSSYTISIERWMYLGFD
jgi:hypothetical protein